MTKEIAKQVIEYAQAQSYNALEKYLKSQNITDKDIVYCFQHSATLPLIEEANATPFNIIFKAFVKCHDLDKVISLLGEIKEHDFYNCRTDRFYENIFALMDKAIPLDGNLAYKSYYVLGSLYFKGNKLPDFVKILLDKFGLGPFGDNHPNLLYLLADLLQEETLGAGQFIRLVRQISGANVPLLEFHQAFQENAMFNAPLECAVHRLLCSNVGVGFRLLVAVCKHEHLLDEWVDFLYQKAAIFDIGEDNKAIEFNLRYLQNRLEQLRHEALEGKLAELNEKISLTMKMVSELSIPSKSGGYNPGFHSKAS